MIWRPDRTFPDAFKIVGGLLLGCLVLFLLGLLVGCGSMPRPLRGGTAAITPPAGGGGSAVSLSQPENPATASAQEHESSEETSVPVPAGSTITQRSTEVANGRTNSTELAVTVPSPTEIRRVRTEATKQQIGAAQKDMGREIAAKLSSMRPVQFVGILFVVAAVAMLHPVAKGLVGSTTVQIVTGATGLALIILPVVLVGNEKLILLAALIPAVWWIIHRNASKSTEVRVLREMIDLDKDGIDDRDQDTASAKGAKDAKA